MVVLACLTPLGAGPLTFGDEPRGGQVIPRASADLFQRDKIWSIHLRFAPDQWAALEPSTSDGKPFGGMPPGPSPFIAPAILAQADRDGDGQISSAEFRELGERWFTAWDKMKAGKLTRDQLRDGLNTAFGPPPGAAGSPPRMNLQGPPGQAQRPVGDDGDRVFSGRRDSRI